MRCKNAHTSSTVAGTSKQQLHKAGSGRVRCMLFVHACWRQAKVHKRRTACGFTGASLYSEASQPTFCSCCFNPAKTSEINSTRFRRQAATPRVSRISRRRLRGGRARRSMLSPRHAILSLSCPRRRLPRILPVPSQPGLPLTETGHLPLKWQFR